MSIQIFRRHETFTASFEVTLHGLNPSVLGRNVRRQVVRHERLLTKRALLSPHLRLGEPFRRRHIRWYLSTSVRADVSRQLHDRQQPSHLCRRLDDGARRQLQKPFAPIAFAVTHRRRTVRTILHIHRLTHPLDAVRQRARVTNRQRLRLARARVF